jgi:hypothetical protein
VFTFLLQDWVTIGGQSSILSVAQGVSGWLALPEFQDAVFWMDSLTTSTGGATTLLMNFETSPCRDENMFLAMATQTIAGSTASSTTNAVLMNNNPAVPLAYWVRWRISATGTLSSSWRTTFRIRVAANATTKYYSTS